VLPGIFLPIITAPERSAVVVDYDGTLAPIVDDPTTAAALDASRAALALLADRLACVAVVSARPVAFLARALDVPGLTIVGQYGAERLVGGEAVLDERVAPYGAAMDKVADDAARALPGLLVERKGVGVTLHWRTSPEREGEARTVGAALAERYELRVVAGRMALELRPPVAIDKGAAVAELLAGIDHAVFAGDDRADLEAFDALDRLVAEGTLRTAVRVAVNSAETPPELLERADHVVAGPPGIAALLRELAGALAP
jgi:trehalose 6-phosphate phosphatase